MKMHNFAVSFAALLCCSFSSAFGGAIQIQLSGVDLTYTDANGGGAGLGSIVNAGGASDPLQSINFFEDGVFVDSLDDPGDTLGLSVSIPALPNIAVPGPGLTTTVNAPGGSLELFANSNSILDLNLDTVSVQYSNLNFGMFSIRILFAGSIADIASQDLPFIDPLADPVVVSFSLQGPRTEVAGFLTSFIGSGTGEIAGTTIPEPATLAMMGLGGLMSLIVYSRYRLG